MSFGVDVATGMVSARRCAPAHKPHQCPLRYSSERYVPEWE